MTSRLRASLLIPLCALTVFSAVPSSAMAATFGDTLKAGLNSAAPAELRSTDTDPLAVLGRVIGSLMSILGVVLLLYLLYGGYKYMTAAGDGNQVKEALAIIKNVIIGLVIIALAYALSNFVITTIGTATSPSNSTTASSAPAPGTAQ